MCQLPPVVRRFILSFIAGAAICSSVLAAPSEGVRQAQKRLGDAQTELTRATASFSSVVLKARKTLEATSEWKQAQADVHKAQADHTAAVNDVRTMLRKRPDYQAAVKQHSQAEMNRDALRERPGTPQEELAQASIEVLNASAVVIRLESDAMKSDLNVLKTKVALDEANAKLDALTKTLPDVAKKDPAYEPARQKLEQAAAHVKDASKQVAQAKQQQEEAEARQMDNDIQRSRDQLERITGFRR